MYAILIFLYGLSLIHGCRKIVGGYRCYITKVTIGVIGNAESEYDIFNNI